MNRLNHIEKTLPLNILESLSSANVEFLIIDYNSKDNLKEYILSEMKEYMIKGVLRFIRINGPKYFHRSHSRNIAFMYATGEILVNIDADNYIGSGFTSFIRKQFQETKNIFLVPAKQKSTPLGCAGKVALLKSNFLKVKGYDEQISGWGYEDSDLYNRLIIAGLKKSYYSSTDFLKCIEHENLKRIENQENYQEVKYLFSRRTTHDLEVIIFYKTKKIEIINFKHDYIIDKLMANSILVTGSWREEEDKFYVNRMGGSTSIFVHDSHNNKLKESSLNKIYNSINNKKELINLLQLSECAKNYQIFQKNFSTKKMITNQSIGDLGNSQAIEYIYKGGEIIEKKV